MGLPKHTKIYLDYFGYDINSFIPCELCGAKAIDIHHIIHRSKFGSKRKGEQDEITNLIALCRDCHNKAHANIISKETLQEIVNKRN